MIASSVATWQILEPTPADAWPWAVQALSDIHREVELDTWGYDDLWMPAWVWQPVLAGSPDAGRRLYVALPPRLDAPVADDVVGALHVQLPLRGNTHLAHVDLMVRPAARRAGVGSALLARAERDLAAAGRDVVVCYVGSAPEPPPGPGALLAATGTGRIAAAAPSTRFALAHRYTLEQVARHSVLVVPDDLRRPTRPPAPWPTGPTPGTPLASGAGSRRAPAGTSR